jgi:hypothetical protein
MAATDLTSTAPDTAGIHIVRVALEATAANAREIQLPEWARRVDLQFVQSDDSTDDSGKVASSGTDGSAIGSNAIRVAAGAVYTFRVSAGRAKGGGSLYVAASTASAYCIVCLQPE